MGSLTRSDLVEEHSLHTASAADRRPRRSASSTTTAPVISPPINPPRWPPIEIPEIASPEEERIREMEERLREAQERRQALEEQVFNLARNNPEALADLIKTWLEEEEEARP